jgi:hypothetical protein
MSSTRRIPRAAFALLAFYVAWLVAVCAWLAGAEVLELSKIGLGEHAFDAEPIFDLVFGVGAAVGLLVCVAGRFAYRGLARYAGFSLAFPLLWQASVYGADRFGFPAVRAMLAEWGLAVLFVLGLAWLIWYVERRSRQRSRELRHLPPHEFRPSVSNPFEPDAWYYGRQNRKLNQSLFIFINYGLLFSLACMLTSRIGGCGRVFDLPAGGGSQEAMAQTVKIQKIIRKKYVISPYASVKFNQRNIDDVQIQVEEMTRNQYAVGQGKGDQPGYEGGTATGKIEFVRLQYSGGDWDQDFGVGSDLNMLIQFGLLTNQKRIADQTTSITPTGLKNQPIGKGPPLVYITGQKSISLTKEEIKGLREYLFDKHGMFFIDNGGSSTFHSQAFAMMRQIAPELEPVKVPLDDVIHRRPFPVPFLPYVAPHGGKDAWGWKLDGRWICYYHPGDIGDAWTDTHAGVPKPIWEACYLLGANVMQYANSEYSSWVLARRGK